MNALRVASFRAGLGLSRFYAIRGWTKRPQRRDGRRGRSKGKDAQSNHYSVTCFQVAESGLSLRPSRLCGLICLCSIGWLRLSATVLLFAAACLAAEHQEKIAEPPRTTILATTGESDWKIVLRPNASGPETLAAGELARYVRAIAQAELPILKGSSSGAHTIAIDSGAGELDGFDLAVDQRSHHDSWPHLAWRAVWGLSIARSYGLPVVLPRLTGRGGAGDSYPSPGYQDHAADRFFPRALRNVGLPLLL